MAWFQHCAVQHVHPKDKSERLRAVTLYDNNSSLLPTN